MAPGVNYRGGGKAGPEEITKMLLQACPAIALPGDFEELKNGKRGGKSSTKTTER